MLCHANPVSKRSLVFVANNHHVWDPNRQRKIRRKYGKLKKSDHSDLNEMLAEHMEEVQELLLQKKAEREEEDKLLHMAEEEQQGLRSPPLASGFASPQSSGAEAYQTTNKAPLRSPRLSQGPQLG